MSVVRSSCCGEFSGSEQRKRAVGGLDMGYERLIRGVRASQESGAQAFRSSSSSEVACFRRNNSCHNIPYLLFWCMLALLVVGGCGECACALASTVTREYRVPPKRVYKPAFHTWYAAGSSRATSTYDSGGRVVLFDRGGGVSGDGCGGGASSYCRGPPIFSSRAGTRVSFCLSVESRCELGSCQAL